MSTLTSARKPKGRPRIDAVPVNVRFPPDQLEALDAFIEERRRDFGEEVTRPQAVRKLTADGLIGAGLLKPISG